MVSGQIFIIGQILFGSATNSVLQSCRFFQVIIITFSSVYSGVVKSPQSFAPQDLLTYEEAHESSVPAAYVTFQFGGNDFNKYREFVVGNEARSNSKTRSKRSCDDDKQFYNKPLQPNTNYRVFLRAFVTEVFWPITTSSYHP